MISFLVIFLIGVEECRFGVPFDFSWLGGPMDVMMVPFGVVISIAHFDLGSID